MKQGSLVALTGGSGFVGSHVAEALLREGYRVRALVRRPESPGWLAGLPVELVVGDVRRQEALGALVEGAAAVVHAAGKTSARNEAEYRATNTEGVANVARAAHALSPGTHFVLISSIAAGGPSLDGKAVKTDAPPHPVSSYGRSKLGGEEETARVGLPFTILRPSAVYGPRETAIRDLFVAASRGIVPVVAWGRPKIQLVYAEDAARAVVGALRRGGRGETFVVAHPEVLDYRSIAETLASLPKKRPLLVSIPAFLVRAAGVAVEAATALGKGPPVFNREKAVELLQPAWLNDVGLAEEALGRPFRTPFAEGAVKTWDWYRSYGWIKV